MRTLTALIYLWVVFGLCSNFTFASVDELSRSQLKALEVPDEESGTFSLGLRHTNGLFDSAKFLEYRDMHNGLFMEEFSFKRPGSFRLNARNLGRDDMDMYLRYGYDGHGDVEVEFNRIPHTFSLGSATLFNAPAGSIWSLPAGLQADMQGSANRTAVANKVLNAYLPVASRYRIGVQRDRTHFRLKMNDWDPAVTVDFRRDHRTGTQTKFGSFGFSNTMELIVPVDYETDILSIDLMKEKGRVIYSANLYFSNFYNGFDAFRWGNPFRATDGTSGRAYVFLHEDGPAWGLMDLAPDNQSRQYSLGAIVNDLPKNGRVTFNYSKGKMTQDDVLYPYTTNSAIFPGAANGPPVVAALLSSLPTQAVNNKVETELWNLTYSLDLTERLDGRFSFRSYERDTVTPITYFPGYVRSDAVWEAIPIHTEPLSYEKQNLKAQFGYRLNSRWRIGLELERESYDRHHREVANQDDDIFKLSATREFDKFEVRYSFENADRDYKRYDFTVPFGGVTPNAQLPWLRKYDEANRKRKSHWFLATFFPRDRLSYSVGYRRGKDDFHDSLFGLQADEHKEYSFDVDYQFSRRLSAQGFYVKEEYFNRQAARQWTPRRTGDPYVTDVTPVSASNWTADLRDDYRTYGLDIQFDWRPDKLTLEASFSRSESDGLVQFASVVGGATDANNFTPVPYTEVDDTRLDVWELKLDYKVKKNQSLILAFRKEDFRIQDYNLDGYSNMPTNAAGNPQGALFVDTLTRSYKANLVSLSYKVSF